MRKGEIYIYICMYIYIYVQNRMLPEDASMIQETIVGNMQFHSPASGTRAPEIRILIEDLYGRCLPRRAYSSPAGKSFRSSYPADIGAGGMKWPNFPPSS